MTYGKYGASKAPQPVHIDTRALVERLIREHVRQHLGRLVLAAVCMVCAAAATAAYAWLMEPVLNKVFVNKDATMLVVLPVAVVAIFLVRSGATYGHSVLMNHVGQRIIADIQFQLFDQLLRADLAFFHNTATGELISRLTNDTNLLRAVVSGALTGIVKHVFTVVFLVGVMVYQDWLLSLVAIFVFPLAILPMVIIGRRIRKLSAAGLAQVGRLSSLLNDTFQGIRHVKAYGMEGYESDRASAVVERLFRLVCKNLRMRAASSPIMELFSGVAIAMFIFYAGRQVIAETLTIGAFFSFLTALLLTYQPIKGLVSLNASLQEGLAAAQRVFAMLDSKPQVKNRPGALPLTVSGGTIRFESVSFAYTPDTPTLSVLSLAVPAGATVALVGPSGGGKSTILNLILRFYDVDRGSILIDDTDIRDVTIESLRGAIAMVSQEVSLFNDTVRANIAYGKPGCSQGEIVVAARAAAAHDFITELPAGYDTLVGEHGVKLSGGQRQRLSIARAILKNAPILLLDEATSSLDSESERMVQAALARLKKGRTTLVIAHRLSTVMEADITYVIEDSRVVESGSHAQLLAQGGVYARLFAMQFADGAERSTAALAGA